MTKIYTEMKDGRDNQCNGFWLLQDRYGDLS